MNNEAPTAFAMNPELLAHNKPVTPASRGRRPLFGKKRRVFLGITVDESTIKQADKWAAKSLSRGLVTDQVYRHAKKTAFRPNRAKRT